MKRLIRASEIAEYRKEGIMKRRVHKVTAGTKYQCYYNETLGDKHYIGKKILDKVFDTEEEAERYCRGHVGIQELGDGDYIEHEMRYEEIPARTVTEADDHIATSMNRLIRASENSPVTLSVKYESYPDGNIRKAKVSGDNLADALLNMCDKMHTYVDEYWEEEFEEENQRPATDTEILERLEETNGDGSDFIIELKNLTTGDTLMEYDYDEEEDWDE